MERGTKTVLVLIVAAAVFAAGTLYVALVLRESASRRLLLVRVTVNVTTDAPPTVAIPADFGPHCAPARFGPTGGLVIDSDVLPTNATGVVYLEYRPVGPFATIGGGVALLFFRESDPGANVVSSVAPAKVLFTLEKVGSTTSVVVIDLVYRVGERFVEGPFITPVTVEQNTWTVNETFSGVNVGLVGVTVVAPKICA